MFHGPVMLLVLITPLGWADRGKVLLPSKQGSSTHTQPPGATLPCVTDQEIELPLVYDQSPCQPFSVSHAALGKCPGYKNNRFPDFASLQQARICNELQERRRGPTGICQMPSKPGRDDRMTDSLKLQFLDLSEACTYVPGESAIDNYAGHIVGRMPEPLKIGFRFSRTLEGCRIAGLHIDADDVPRIVVHRIPQPAVSRLHITLQNVL